MILLVLPHLTTSTWENVEEEGKPHFPRGSLRNPRSMLMIHLCGSVASVSLRTIQRNMTNLILLNVPRPFLPDLSHHHLASLLPGFYPNRTSSLFPQNHPKRFPAIWMASLHPIARVLPSSTNSPIFCAPKTCRVDGILADLSAETAS